MVELRWLERETGKILMNEHGYYEKETEKVLQYRFKEEKSYYSYNSINSNPEVKELTWCDWKDVETVVLTKEKMQ